MNRRQYTVLRAKLDAYNQASDNWRKANKINGIPLEVCKTFPFAKIATNENYSKVEVYEFVNNSPTKYFVYLNEKTKEATTWTGEVLGRVSFGRPYRSNFGDKRVPIDVHAINGVKYHGIYFTDAGSYARITAYKTNH